MWRAKDLLGLVLLYSAKDYADNCKLSRHSKNTAEVVHV